MTHTWRWTDCASKCAHPEGTVSRMKTTEWIVKSSLTAMLSECVGKTKPPVCP